MSRCNHCKNVDYSDFECRFGFDASAYCMLVDEEVFFDVSDGERDCDLFVGDPDTYSCYSCIHSYFDKTKNRSACRCLCSLKRGPIPNNVCKDYEDRDGWKLIDDMDDNDLLMEEMTDVMWKVLQAIENRPKLRFKEIVDAVGDIDDTDEALIYLSDISLITSGPVYAITSCGRKYLKKYQKLLDRNEGA